jgi:hypothetical protein
MLGPNRPMAARRDVAPIDGRGAEHFELRKQRKVFSARPGTTA